MTVILAAVDDTPAARAVLATASAIRSVLRGEATALYVGDLDGATAAAAREYGMPLVVVRGRPTDEIIATAERDDVDLVVLARQGLPGRHAPGDTAIAVAGRLSMPVVVVPPDSAVRPTPRRVLFPLDGTRGVSAGVRPLIARYVAAGIEVIALHVFEPATVPRFLDGPQDGAVWRAEFLARHCAQLNIRLRARPGPTVAALLDAADADDVDVIALGWHHDASSEHAHVVREVLGRSARPVALIPLPEVAPPERDEA